ncbi:hypothetical protein [Actinomadura atramentaria]|uniref:hypothetical protein n=1 Tax=Actinomadura atramentaria TaxID=1990 RepID=UPI00036D38BF|nr:hypothetical protein [Actinomadura atramentaria]
MSVPLPTDPAASTVYLDWAKAHAPAHIPDAERLVEALRTGVHSRRPGRFLDELARPARALPPEHLPWYWDTVAHRFLRVGTKQAGEAYLLARAAEAEPVDAAYRAANAALLARAGALPARALREHRAWLAATFPADRAHRDFAALLTAWRGAAPPADLVRLVRASAKAAGLGVEEEARVLGRVLARCGGTALSDGLLDAAAAVFAKAPPEPDDLPALAALFPTGATDGAAFLRMLDAAGVLAAFADGSLEPDGGLAAWLGGFPFHYSYVRVPGGGITAQRPPAELFAAVERLAPRIDAPVALHRSQYRARSLLDAELLDACLAAGVPVEHPGPRHELHVRNDGSGRDLAALAADPDFGPLLERTLQPGHWDGPGTALTRLRPGSGIEAGVHARVDELLRAVADQGAWAAGETLRELGKLLDTPTLAALDGVADALAALDLTAPVLRTLRAGIPAELGWPAFDEAVAELGEVVGCTASWPVLTLYGRDRAVAVGPSGRVGACAFAVPEDAKFHTVHYVGGDFLVASGTIPQAPRRVFWAGEPGAVAEVQPSAAHGVTGDVSRVGHGDQFAVGGGRFDGRRVLRPGDAPTVAFPLRQVGDGARVWSADAFGDRADWQAVDAATGEAVAAPAPAFCTVPRAGYGIDQRSVLLARLLAGVSSPLGDADGLSGARILVTGGEDPHRLVESADGRAVRLPAGDRSLACALLRIPEADAVLVVRESDGRIEAIEPATALWRAAVAGVARRGEAGPPVPPLMFWHFLAPRDPASSRALRALDASAVRALLDGAPPPGVADPVIAASAAEIAGRLTRLRDELAGRARIVASGALVRPAADVGDAALLPALRGLVANHVRGASRHHVSPLPVLATAVAADGAFLAGDVDERVRAVSRLAEPRDWTVLLGRIDAVVRRVLSPAAEDGERAALADLLRTWARTPFAAPGEWRVGFVPNGSLPPGAVGAARTYRGQEAGHRFVQRAAEPAPADAKDTATAAVTRDDAARLARALDLLAERGPAPVPDEAVEAFARRTGTRLAVARYVLDGLRSRCDLGTDFVTNIEEQRRALRAKPYGVARESLDEVERTLRRLDYAGHAAVLAAGVPGDPAELWTRDGAVAAAERMADEWAARLGARPPVDEELAAALERDTGLGAGWAAALGDPAQRAVPGPTVVLTAYGNHVWLNFRDADGKLQRLRGHAYAERATAVAWACAERPVGDPALAGLRAAADRLRAVLDTPGLISHLGYHRVGRGRTARAALFGPDTVTAAPDRAEDRPFELFDDGLLLIRSDEDFQRVLFRPAGLADAALVADVLEVCEDNGLDRLAAEVRRELAVRDVARLVERALDSPVPAGRYEYDPSCSVPELVADVRAATGADADAAALYLQLLTLAHPTDANVRRWNGWKPARHKAAQDELAALGLVVVEKRARARRTAFIPGEWQETKSPVLPLEAFKVEPYLLEVSHRNEVTGPFLRVLPPRPIHEMFQAAWAART